MEIRNLYTFLQVASTLNITQASEVLGYSQSNVSMQIQQLESELGVRLFDRVGRGIALTHYGEDLIPYAQQVVSAIYQLQHSMLSESEITGTLRIGIVESVFAVCFKTLIQKFNRRFPKVRIDVTVDGTTTLQKLLVKNEIDVACLIDSPLTNTKLIDKYSHMVDIVLVANINHPLAKKEHISFTELASHHFILMENTAPYNVLFQQQLVAADVKIEPFLTLQSCDMARILVEDDNYISLLPIYSVKKSILENRIAVLPVEKFSIQQHVQIAISKQKFITPQIDGFIQTASEVFDDILSI